MADENIESEYYAYNNKVKIISIIDEEMLQYEFDFNKNLEKNFVDEIIQKINDSNISEQDKELLMNRDLLENVLSYYDDVEKNDLLITKLNNFSIEEKDFEDETIFGHYDPLKPNRIFIKINCPYREKTLVHEFIHFLQNDNNKYNYLIETTAELMSNEYLGLIEDRSSAYNEGVQSLKLLIDIIGPEPVLKSMFGRDNTMLEGILAQNLSKQDYIELVGYFSKSPKEVINKEAKIRKILKKLYRNIYGQDISQDENIMYNIVYEKLLFNSQFYPVNKKYLRKDMIDIPTSIIVNTGLNDKENL